MREYLTVNQVATLLHVSPTTVRRWIYQGSLNAQKIKTGRNARVLIDKADLDTLLIPVREYAPSESEQHRKAAVDRIVDLRRQFASRGIDVETLVNENRQERDRE